MVEDQEGISSGPPFLGLRINKYRIMITMLTREQLERFIEKTEGDSFLQYGYIRALEELEKEEVRNKDYEAINKGKV